MKIEIIKNEIAKILRIASADYSRVMGNPSVSTSADYSAIRDDVKSKLSVLSEISFNTYLDTLDREWESLSDSIQKQRDMVGDWWMMHTDMTKSISEGWILQSDIKRVYEHHKKCRDTA